MTGPRGVERPSPESAVPNGPILLIDTATTRALIALGAPDGSVLEQRSWIAGYRHGEELLARIDALLTERGLAPAALGAIAVGTGPGAFTGLRVGIATAKGLAHALRLPIVGVATGLALLEAARAVAPEVDRLVLLQPAGPNDATLLRPGEAARIIPGGQAPDLVGDERIVAVDLDGRADEAATTLGAAAVQGLAAAMLRAAARRLADGTPDDLARLVPEYVTLPRGVRMPVPDQGVEVTGGGPKGRPA